MIDDNSEKRLQKFLVSACIHEHFVSFEDPRIERTKLHDLKDIVSW